MATISGGNVTNAAGNYMYGACASNNNAKLIRYVVEIAPLCGDAAIQTAFGGANTGSTFRVFSNAIKVTGITLGEEGTVDVPQWGVTGMLADGQRKLSPLAIDFRVDNGINEGASGAAPGDIATNQTDLVFLMFEKRAVAQYNINVYITDRSFKALFVYNFLGCGMRKLTMDDQELGAAKLGVIMTEFLPLDVTVRGCQNTFTRVNSRQASSDFTVEGCLP